MLRVYAAAHGLTSTHHAVVEVGSEEIVLRVDKRWVRFSRDAMTNSEGASTAFTMHENGSIKIGEETEDMDMAAERVAREIMRM